MTETPPRDPPTSDPPSRDPPAADLLPEPRFRVGQLVQHRLFGYRGVIVDAHPVFQGSEEWYHEVAKSRPPKDRPWYEVLVHDSPAQTYVAERNLEEDISGEPIEHPLLRIFFREFDKGLYRVGGLVN